MSQVSEQALTTTENDIASTCSAAENVRPDSVVAESTTVSTVNKEELPVVGNSCWSFEEQPEAAMNKNAKNVNKITNKVKSFTCSTCLKQFLSKSALIRHVFSHIPDAQKPGDICELCGEVFHSPSFLQKHVMSFHVGKFGGNGVLAEQDDEKHIAHSLCDKSFAKPPKKKRRRIDATAGNLIYCTLCGKSFLRFDLLRKHYMLHTGEEPYRCDTCSKIFVQRGLLNKHQFVHAEVQPYACSSCPERFPSPHALRQHTLMHASGSGTVYNCEMCGVPFAEHGALRRHWMCHTGEDPYQCDVCSKSFAHLGHLRMHRLGHLEEAIFI